ncbi:MAG: SCP2 sterol-binding domain-containing protein [Burkholderiales bacterium]|nr:SCP2 sterol-binding domain-containing protein [Burkholderiales bacterium]
MTRRGPRIPGFVARINRRLPQWPPTLALVATLQAARLAKLLDDEALSPLCGRVFEIDVTDMGLRCRFGYGRRGFAPAWRDPDVRFRAPLEAFLALAAREEDADTLFFQRRLVVEGDTELGLAVRNLLDAIEWEKWPLFALLKGGRGVRRPEIEG